MISFSKEIQNNMSDEKNHTNTIYDAAFSEQYDVLKNICKTDGDFTMAIMGICSRQEELLQNARTPKEMKKVYKTLSQEEKKRVKALEKMWQWCADNGACMLFGIQQDPKPYQQNTRNKGDSFFNRVSMRRGPGDIAKGSFAKGNKKGKSQREPAQRVNLKKKFRRAT